MLLPFAAVPVVSAIAIDREVGLFAGFVYCFSVLEAKVWCGCFVSGAENGR